MDVEQTQEWKLAQFAHMRAQAKRERRSNIIAISAATVSICFAALTIALFVIVDHIRNERWYTDDEQWNEEIMARLERIELQLAVQETILTIKREDTDAPTQESSP